MKRLVLLMIFSAAFAATFVSVSCHAQMWIGGTSFRWDVPGNWGSGAIPFDSSRNSTVAPFASAVVFEGNARVRFDDDSWSAVSGNLKTVSPVVDEFWGMGRLVMGNVAASPGAVQSFVFNHGGTNVVNFPDPVATIIGQATGNTSSVDVASGIVEIRSDPLGLGGDPGSGGTIILRGGELRLAGSVFNVGGATATDGEGEVIISGGTFSTGEDVTVGGNGTFEVLGSCATLIEIGSSGAGNWTQRNDGVLRVGLDGRGATPINIIGSGGSVTFEPGAILDPFDVGGAGGGTNNVWRTVMTWDGALNNGTSNLALSNDAMNAGWAMQFITSGSPMELQVRNPSVPISVWTGLGSPIFAWESPANWSNRSIPKDPNDDADDFGPDVEIEGGVVEFDADSWNFVVSNNRLNSAGPLPDIREFWGMGRLLMGNRVHTPSFPGAPPVAFQLFLFDHGGTNVVNLPSTAPTIIGAAMGNESAIEVASGIVEIGSNTLGLGSDPGSSGTIRLTGGELRLAGSLFNIADTGLVSVDGEGEVIISGGVFSTDGDVNVGENGTFEVVGSSPARIEIGTSGTGDWTQRNGGVLRVGLDGRGITPIDIMGDVTFESGAILDPYDAGGYDGSSLNWCTVMTRRGALNNGTSNLALSSDAMCAGWTMRFNPSTPTELQVRNPSIFPSGGLGDFNADGVVDCNDLLLYSCGGSTALPRVPLFPEVPLDLDNDDFLTMNDADIHIRTLIVTSNGVTGTFPGDFNCDGRVSVIPDAFNLVSGLGRTGLKYIDGDINFDGMGNVLGDAFIFIANLGMSN